jgi:hypothetical protein
MNRPGDYWRRWAANRHARAALHALADNSRYGSPWAAKPYADARGRSARSASSRVGR